MTSNLKALVLAAFVATPFAAFADAMSSASQALSICAGAHPDGKKVAKALTKAGFAAQGGQQGIAYFVSPDGAVLAGTSPANDTPLRCLVTFEGMSSGQAKGLAEAFSANLGQASTFPPPQKEVLGIWLGKLNGNSAIVTAIAKSEIGPVTGASVVISAQ